MQRLNRFTATVRIDGKEILCHIPNTGRLRELLHKGAPVWLKLAEQPNRKTAYDLIAAEKNGKLFSIDSFAPNRATAFFLREQLGEYAKIQPEKTYRNSRFDFYIETNGRKIFLEVKGVTLEQDGIALFPDAPTERGAKHLRELSECIDDGYEAAVLFVIQFSPVCAFQPNEKQDPAFTQALRQAHQKGVRILAYDCAVAVDSIRLNVPIPVLL